MEKIITKNNRIQPMILSNMLILYTFIHLCKSLLFPCWRLFEIYIIIWHRSVFFFSTSIVKDGGGAPTNELFLDGYFIYF